MGFISITMPMEIAMEENNDFSVTNFSILNTSGPDPIVVIIPKMPSYLRVQRSVRPLEMVIYGVFQHF